VYHLPDVATLPADHHSIHQAALAGEIANETHIPWDEEERDEDIQKAIRSAQDG
jgi:hypothetical protein